MGIHEGHRERRRKLYEKAGLDAFADHEVLEMILFYALPRRDTNELAHQLIKTFGSLRRVLLSPAELLAQIPGIGNNAAVLLSLFGSVYERLARPEPPKKILGSLSAAGAFFFELLKDKQEECLYAICADSKGQVKECRLLSSGSSNIVEVSTRVAIQQIMISGATIIVLAHNHPSGVALASPEDIVATRQLQTTLQPMGVQVLDHFVVSNDDYTSMLQSGYLSPAKGALYAGF